jgi:hypothetical protein
MVKRGKKGYFLAVQEAENRGRRILWLEMILNF